MSGMAEPTGASLGRRQFIHFPPYRMWNRFDDHLGDTHVARYLKRLSSVIDQRHTNLTTVIGIVAVMAWFAKSRAVPLLIGAIVAVAPVTIRNAKSGEFVPISHNGGINFYIGNNSNYDATVGIRPDREWKQLTTEPARAGVTGARSGRGW